MLGLVSFNVVMGTNQELKALASVEALAQLQVPQARVRRSGQVEEVDSTGLVPGDVVLIEAGDLVPADARIVTSATLEVQEAALTGESAPIAKDAGDAARGRRALGDRTNLVFQNTQVTRGSATFVVTATGTATQMGQHRRHGHGDEAHQVAAAARARRPDQGVRHPRLGGGGRHRHLRDRPRPGRRDAGAAVHLDRDRGHPDGPADVRAAMLSSGAQRLAEAKAVVKSLTDVETLGGTTVINSDKTGTLTMNAMTATTMLAGGDWYKIEGGGYKKTGAILGVAGREAARLHPPGARPGAVQRRHRRPTTGRSSATRPRRRSWCWPRRWASTPRRPARPLPRRAEVPFDSEYKFMATFHDRPDWLAGGILTNRTSSA